MAAIRKAPKKPSRPIRRRKETLDEKLERILAQPVEAAIPSLTKRESIAMLRKLRGRGDPDAPSGDEVIKRFYGLWPEPADNNYPD